MKRKRDRKESKATRARLNKWMKWLLKDRDYDFSFLLEMEKLKLKQMHELFLSTDIFIGQEKVRRDIGICIRLLDIMLGNDNLQIKISHSPATYNPATGLYSIQSPSKLMGYRRIHINIKNAHRFDMQNNCTSEISNVLFKESLRMRKAYYLYHKIRAYNMQNWWY